MTFLEQYIDGIEKGTIVVSHKTRQLYVTMLKPIVEGKDSKYMFSEKPGLLFINFVEKLCIIPDGDAVNQPAKLMLFQKAKYEALLGILDRETKKRRFTECFDVRGRKNGKTTEEAFFAVFQLFIRKGSTIFAIATTRTQALTMWLEAVYITQNAKELKPFFTATSKWAPEPTLRCSAMDSEFRVLSSNPKTKDGKNASVAIIDEVHELPETVYDIMKQSQSLRDQPLMMMITTSGFVRGALFDNHYEMCTKILDGTAKNDSIFPLIYELDPDEIKDNRFLTDESCWIKANPSLGYLRPYKFIRDEISSAQIDPTKLNSLKTKDFNIVGVTNTQWLSAEQIMGEPDVSADTLKSLDNTVALGGMDLAHIGDCTAFTTLLFDTKNKVVIAKSMYWVTQAFLDSPEAKASGVPWLSWIDQGLVRISGTNMMNDNDVSNYVMNEVTDHGYVYDHIGYDPWSTASLIEDFANFGFSKDHCLTRVVQGFRSLNMPMQVMLQLMNEHRLSFLKNPVTIWMLSNCQCEKDRNDNMMISKKLLKRQNKIDGPATILDALYSFCQNANAYLPGVTFEATTSNESGGHANEPLVSNS